jgi:hypothetical protein
MLSTYATARDFTNVGAEDPAAVNKALAAATTALGVLIPGEVVSAATLVTASLSLKADKGEGTATWAHIELARLLMLVLGLIAIPLLFRIGATSWAKNGFRGILLLVLTMISFAGWLVLQPLSIYQDWFTLDQGELAAIGLVAGIVIAALAGLLGWSQANKKPEDDTHQNGATE